MRIFFLLCAIFSLARSLNISITQSCMPNTCTSTLQNAINQCNSRPNPDTDLCTITFQPGVYVLNTENGNPQWRITWKNGKNTRITGNGQAELQINAYSNPAGLFLVSYSQDLTFDGFFVDFVRVPFSFGQVISTSSNNAVLKVDQSDYPFPAQDQPWLFQVQAIMEYDTVNQRPAVNALDDYLLDTPASCTYNTSASTLTVVGNYNMQVNKWYILRHQVYSFQIFDLTWVTNTLIKNVTLYAAAGMGAVGTWCNTITVENMAVLKRNNRPMSICADGLHFQLCTGDIRITDSTFIGQGDDAVNVPGHYQQVIQKVANNQIILAGRDQTATAPEINIGDTIRFRNRDTFQPYFDTVLSGINGNIATLRDNLPAQFKIWDLTLDQSAVPSSLVVQNNLFKDNRARGVLVPVANTIVSGNTFDHNSGPAVLVDPDGCYWFEGDVVTNWTISGNTISGCNYGPGKQNGDIWMAACHPDWNSDGTPSTNGNPVTTSQVFRQVTISDNKITQDQGQETITVYGVDGLTAHNNIISYTTSPDYNLFASNSINVDMSSNTCYQNGNQVNCKIGTPSV